MTRIDTLTQIGANTKWHRLTYVKSSQFIIILFYRLFNLEAVLFASLRADQGMRSYSYILYSQKDVTIPFWLAYTLDKI